MIGAIAGAFFVIVLICFVIWIIAHIIAFLVGQKGGSITTPDGKKFES